MRRLRVAQAQINTTVGDLEGNCRRILDSMEGARAAGADVVTLPELAVTGYPPEDLLLRPRFIQDNLESLHSIAAETRGIVAVVGFVDSADDLYNAAAVIAEGRVVDVYRKQHLPNYGVFDENRYFQAGSRSPVYLIAGVGVGVNICEDIWYPGDPTRSQAHAGAEVILNINSSPYHAGKRSFRQMMLGTRASDYACIVCYTNLVGGQDELVFDGGSMVLDERGHLLAAARQFQEDLLVTDLDIEGVFRTRLHDPRRRKERLEYVAGDGETPTVISQAPAAVPKPPLEPRVEPPLPPEEEVYQALVVGTRDYLRKTGFSKALVALSGGIDSSLVAAVAVEALGAENVVGLSMPSRYSSEGSISDARALADALGIELRTIPIEPAFAAYLDLLAPIFEGLRPDVTEENIQARIRGNLAMALSNKFGWIVLTTGNKSEMACGYATLYGDTAGGFAVIKDVPKTLVYHLAEHVNRRAGREVISAAVIAKPPSAELRPDQRDEDTLPPYPVLDPILQAYVEEDRSPEEIVARGFDEATVRRVVEMVNKSEYKRRQTPPGVKITPRAFGRDRRLPIANRYRG